MSSASVFPKGKNQGLTFEEVRRTRPWYVKWTQREHAEKGLNGYLLNFFDYCNAEDARWGTSTPSVVVASNTPVAPASSAAAAGAAATSVGPSSSSASARANPTAAANPNSSTTTSSGQNSRNANPSSRTSASVGVYNTSSGPQQSQFARTSQFGGSTSTGTASVGFGQSESAFNSTQTPFGSAASHAGPNLKRPSDSTSANNPSAKRQSTGTGAGSLSPRGSSNEDQHVCEKCETPDLPFPGAFRCGQCWRKHCRKYDQPFYIRCSINEKDDAKRRGAKWDGMLKKWYVPAGKDISQLEKWFIRCDKCGEGLSDHPDRKYNPNSISNPPVCTPECEIDRKKREEAEQAERERKEREEFERLKTEKERQEAEKRRQEQKKRAMKEFLDFVKQEAEFLEETMIEKNEKTRNNKSKKKQSILFHIPEGGLKKCFEDHVNRFSFADPETLSSLIYNPFAESVTSKMHLPLDAQSWLRSFRTKNYEEDPNCDKWIQKIDFAPETILHYAATFYRLWLGAWWEGFGTMCIRKHQDFIKSLLLQTLDAITPDIKSIITEKLRADYGTTCADVVGIFGTRILPRIYSATSEQRYRELTKTQKAHWCVLEYMRNRTRYDSLIFETPATTYMRDVLNKMIEIMLVPPQDSNQPSQNGPSQQDADEVLVAHQDASQASSSQKSALFDGSEQDGIQSRIVATQLSRDEMPPRVLGVRYNEARDEAIYYTVENEGSCFLLKRPNTAGVDLFSRDAIEKGCAELGIEPPPPDEVADRIFTLFRLLHFRMTRRTTGDPNELSFPRYGLDEGLRESDRNNEKYVQVKTKHRKYHDQVLQGNWVVRDFLGYEGKKKHNNTGLTHLLFCDHLRLDSAVVNKFETAARIYIDELRGKAETTNAQLRRALEEEYVGSLELAEE